MKILDKKEWLFTDFIKFHCHTVTFTRQQLSRNLLCYNVNIVMEQNFHLTTQFI